MLEARSRCGQGARTAVCWAAGVWLASCTLELDLDRYRFVDPAAPPAADRAVPPAAASGDVAGPGATNETDPSAPAAPRATADAAPAGAGCTLGSSRVGRCTLALRR